MFNLIVCGKQYHGILSTKTITSLNCIVVARNQVESFVYTIENDNLIDTLVHFNVFCMYFHPTYFSRSVLTVFFSSSLENDVLGK